MYEGAQLFKQASLEEYTRKLWHLWLCKLDTNNQRSM